MKHLLPTTTPQTISILPRFYTETVVLLIRDDSTNENAQINVPDASLNKNYIDISTNFNLTEGRFYDLTVCKIKDYEDFKSRVEADGGIWVDNICLFNFYDSIELLNLIEANVIYKDKIFCTEQSTNQSNNESYSVNKDEYVEKSANNDFIIL